MSGMLRIQPQHGEFIPSPDWEPAGVAPNGRQLYRERFRTNEAVPMMEEVLNHDGSPVVDSRTGKTKMKRVWKRHPINGEPLYPMNQRNIVVKERLFFAESQGNYNVEKHFYKPPTAEEIARAEREGKVTEMYRTFAEALVDTGLTPDEVVRRLTQYGPVMTTEQLAEAERHAAIGLDEDPTQEYPVQLARGEYRLSDGSTFKGNKSAAEDAEIEVMRRREEARDNPAF